uniref:Uncharacterized protein n=1 Tax=Arundo donax TaxID=35708 RepID=A0A0A9BIP6_ARUDO
MELTPLGRFNSDYVFLH